MCLNTAHSTGDRESASNDAAALAEGTHTSQTWAAAGGIKGAGREAKKAKRVAATSWGLAVLGTYRTNRKEDLNLHKHHFLALSVCGPNAAVKHV